VSNLAGFIVANKKYSPMQDSIKDPEALSEVNSLDVSDELREFVKQLHKEIGEQNTDRTQWENRQDIWQKKRHGVRSPKSHPWVGAANFVIPMIDSDINRLKPAYVALIGVTPVVIYEPYGAEDVDAAKKRESLFDWRMRTQVKFFQPYCLGVDYALSRGYTVFKIGWRFETRKYTKCLYLEELSDELLEAFFMPEVDDTTLFKILAEETSCDLGFQENVDEINEVIKDFRAGESRFEMTFVEKAENRVEVTALDPRDEIYFPVWVRDLQESPWIDEPFWTTKNKLLRGMKEGRYEEYDESTVSGWAKTNQQKLSSNRVKDLRDGVSSEDRWDEDILCHQVCAWNDVDGDGILEKVLITYPDADPDKVLRFLEVPYDHGMFPYVAVRREFNDGSIMSSRGIPVLDDDFQTGTSTLFNQDIDAGTIATTPTVVTRQNSVKNLKNPRYVPGNVVETENGAADYTIMQQPNVGQQHRFASMQYLKSWANERIGNVAAAVSGTNNQPGSGTFGQKTAKEVQAIESAGGQLQSMDLQVWQFQMSQVYEMIDALYDQFGDEEEYVAITNEAPQKVTRKDIQGRFNRVPNGKLDNASPVMRVNKALSVYQLFRGDPDVDQLELKRYYMSEIDGRLAQRLLLNQPERVEQARTVEAQKAQAVNLQLGLKRAANMLDIEKEAYLVKIQGKKYAKD